MVLYRAHSDFEDMEELGLTPRSLRLGLIATFMTLSLITLVALVTSLGAASTGSHLLQAFIIV